MSSTGPVDGPRATASLPLAGAEGTGGSAALARLLTGGVSLSDLSIVAGPAKGAPSPVRHDGGLPAPTGEFAGLGGDTAHLKASHARERVAAWDAAAPTGDARNALSERVGWLAAGRGSQALADALADGGPAFAHAALGEFAARVRASGGDFEAAARDVLSAARSTVEGAEVVASFGALAATYRLAAPGSDHAVLSAIANELSAR